MTDERRDPTVRDRRKIRRGGRRAADRPVTTRALADAIGASTQFIVGECVDGELREYAFRVGCQWRIRRDGAIQFLAKRNIPETALPA